MRSSRQGAIPSELGDLIDELRNHENRLRTLEAPSGESLSSSVAKLTATLDALLEPVVFSYSQTDVPFTPTAAEHAVTTVTVPAGFTRALVTVTASANLFNNAPPGGWALLMVTPLVNSAGAGVTNWASVTAQEYGFNSTTGAAELAALTAGETIELAAGISFPSAHTLPIARVSGSVLFLR